MYKDYLANFHVYSREEESNLEAYKELRLVNPDKSDPNYKKLPQPSIFVKKLQLPGKKQAGLSWPSPHPQSTLSIKLNETQFQRPESSDKGTNDLFAVPEVPATIQQSKTSN